MPEYKPIWIAEFSNADEIREKLGSKYGIDVEEMKRFAITNLQLRGYNEFNKKHGLRTVIFIDVSKNKRIVAWIQLEDRHTHKWKIRTARYAK